MIQERSHKVFWVQTHHPSIYPLGFISVSVITLNWALLVVSQTKHRWDGWWEKTQRAKTMQRYYQKKRKSNRMFQTVLELGNWGIANGLCYSSDIVSCISIRLNFVTERIKKIGTLWIIQIWKCLCQIWKCLC